MSTAPIQHGGGISAAASRYGGRLEDWLDLSTGINPRPVDLPAIEEAAWHRLPDAHRVQNTRQAAARYYGTRTGLPLPVPGTQAAIQLLPRLVPAGRRVAVVSPTYGEYARVLRAAGHPVDAVNDVRELSPEHGLAVVVNPNNPDGRLHRPEDLLEARDRLVSVGGTLIVDEAFADMVPEASLAGHAGSLPGLLVFRSFGKFFGLAGLRLGFVLGPEDILADFTEWLGPWCVSGPALSIAAGLMNGDCAPIRHSILKRKAALDEVLGGAGLEIVGGTPLFSLVADRHAAEIHEWLCMKHVLVRAFDYDRNWLRFGLTPDEACDRRLAEALSHFSA
ncbi:threonine-phosphate decarboxylase CobD [Mycoplana rhizolycopersici]|uniref:threonine-phosphate decarboxylase n=1 Tax=Mycoplana rhizolycopersici TaxID=2746702 RepID=A0ABX2QJP9_9HYPH|nr:threonine-phosphate decarboxylase CobD [Rhizobium rhizolycopersici]NVP57122.1 threonine-phosphate decarboxylase [Rhizobium rhizolycopersici]